MTISERVMPLSGMTHEEAVLRARALAPIIRERAATAEAQRRQPDETIEDIINAGLVRLLTPVRWGGHELTFDGFVDSVIEIAKADGSTGWCYSFLNMHSWLMATFPEQAQREVWGDNPDALIATSFIPAGSPIRVEDGYLLNGNWPWSSGVDYCEWNMLAGLIMPKTSGEHPEPRIFLLPRSDYEILDTWFVAGQKSTGSKNVVVKNAFIPEHRTIRLSDIREGRAPGSTFNPSPLYQLPLFSAFPSALASPILGATIGAYETWRNLSHNKSTMYSREQVASLTHQQIRLAEVSAQIDSAYLLLKRPLDVLSRGGAVTLEERVRNRRDYAYVAHLCVQATERLFLASGGSANYESNPMQRYWRDVHAMSAHAGLNLDAAGENFGRLELGLLLNSHDPYF
ncbi:MAG: flavin-dependent monooxygenase [Chroococcidiopsidaceae cyanobacterium CP_BM_RX_35]|nr:flavin-dependent monooxygenase [Chroococcidiopsidaceae cyanobacterium CP_BM_RX_35]